MSLRFLSGRLRAAQVEGFIGTDAVLQSWEQKQALLTALRPRDRLRLLGLVRLATDVAQDSLSSPPQRAVPYAARCCQGGAEVETVGRQVVAKRRVQRGGADERRYPTMQLARELVHGTGGPRVHLACRLMFST